MSNIKENQNLEKYADGDLFPLPFRNGEWDANYDLKHVRELLLTLEPPDSPQPLSEFIKRRSNKNDINNSPKNILNDSFYEDSSLDDDDYLNQSSSQENSNADDHTGLNTNLASTPRIFQTPQQKAMTDDGQEPVRNSLLSAIKYKALQYKTPTKEIENSNKIPTSSIKQNDSIVLTQQKLSNSKDSQLFSSCLPQQKRSLFKGLDFNSFLSNTENHLDSIQEIEYSPEKLNKNEILFDVSNRKVSPQTEENVRKPFTFTELRNNSPEVEETVKSYGENLELKYSRPNSSQKSIDKNLPQSCRKTSPKNDENIKQFQPNYEVLNCQQNSRQIEQNMNEYSKKTSSLTNENNIESKITMKNTQENYFTEPKSYGQQSTCQDNFKKPENRSTNIPHKIDSMKHNIENVDRKYLQSSSQINDNRPQLNSNIKKPEFHNINSKSNVQFPLLKSTNTKPTFIGRIIQIQNVEYLIKSKLGNGGSCEVFEGMTVENSRIYAIKCVNLAVDPDTAKGYLSEIELLAKLQTSDYVIKMFAYEQINDKLYVIMEKGEMDLGQLIEKSKNLHIAMIVYYWIEMLTAVKFIHDNGVIHSDLKPANFLLVRGRLKLIDFGIASIVQGECTSIIKNTQAGTLNYISPEALIDTRDFSSEIPNSHVNINISYKSDVWSLGCILYKFLYGKTPFQHITNKMAKYSILTDRNHTIDFPTKNSSIPPKVLTVLKKCLIFEMRKRPSVDELLKVKYICFNNCD